MFNKGQRIGHEEPLIDFMPQTSINSLTTQNMIDKHLQPDLFHTSLTYPPGWCEEITQSITGDI